MKVRLYWFRKLIDSLLNIFDRVKIRVIPLGRLVFQFLVWFGLNLFNSNYNYILTIFIIVLFGYTHGWEVFSRAEFCDPYCVMIKLGTIISLLKNLKNLIIPLFNSNDSSFFFTFFCVILETIHKSCNLIQFPIIRPYMLL